VNFDTHIKARNSGDRGPAQEIFCVGTKLVVKIM
jgi:hypothetical protein